MPAGRPTDYKPEYAEQARKLCEMGATDIELASFFGVTDRTIYNWKHSEPKFFQALIVGKDALDDRVERSLYQRAVGYSFNSEKVFHASGIVTRADVIEHVPPDPGAALSWLKNRRSAKWRDKFDHEHSGSVSIADIIADRRQRVAAMDEKVSEHG